MKKPDTTRSLFRWIGGLFLPLVTLGFCAAFLFYPPNTPLAPKWNPTEPLNPKAQVTAITSWKLRNTVRDAALCRAALNRSGAQFNIQTDREDSEICHIRQRTDLRRIGSAALAPLDTRCEMALRLALWEIHGLQPLAQFHLGAEISRIHHFGSFSCRKIRGSSSRMSQHATANAVDISGFDLKDGRKLRLRNDWTPNSPESAFLRAARDSACDWFGLVLSPDYNAAHHDHFHFDQGRWGGCR